MNRTAILVRHHQGVAQGVRHGVEEGVLVPAAPQPYKPCQQPQQHQDAEGRQRRAAPQHPAGVNLHLLPQAEGDGQRGQHHKEGDEDDAATPAARRRRHRHLAPARRVLLRHLFCHPESSAV